MIKEEWVPKGKQIYKPEWRRLTIITRANAKTGKPCMRREEWGAKGRQITKPERRL